VAQEEVLGSNKMGGNTKRKASDLLPVLLDQSASQIMGGCKI
jgi:hypothetical protein